MRSAIYLDFEGVGKNRAGDVFLPHMAGLFSPNDKGKSGSYSCTFFSETWKVAARGIASATQTDFDIFVDDLIADLERRDCHLIFWTDHERMIFEKFLSAKVLNRLMPRLYNLHPIAKKYLNRFRKFGVDGTARGKTLEECFSAIYLKRHPYPPFPLGAAEACRRIDKGCETCSKWRHLSDKQKSYIKDLVAYNRGDCLSTWLVALRVGNYFAAPT
jgi:hypothetical protein